MSNPGYIFELPDGLFGIAYHKEQEQKFFQLGKYLIHVFRDSVCCDPVIDPSTGKPKKVLKAKELLKFIGFND